MAHGAFASINPDFITAQEFLEGEKLSECRHEYHHGAVIAMAGASQRHEIVSLNLASTIHGHLKGKGCRAFKSDMKLHLEIFGRTFYLYPDIMVACDPADNDPNFIHSPKLLIEVLSENENRDRVEKFLMYQRIPSLEEYAVVSQNPKAPEVTVFRRSEGWEVPHVHTSGEVFFASIGLSVSVEELYVA